MEANEQKGREREREKSHLYKSYMEIFAIFIWHLRFCIYSHVAKDHAIESNATIDFHCCSLARLVSFAESLEMCADMSDAYRSSSIGMSICIEFGAK